MDKVKVTVFKSGWKLFVCPIFILLARESDGGAIL